MIHLISPVEDNFGSENIGAMHLILNDEIINEVKRCQTVLQASEAYGGVDSATFAENPLLANVLWVSSNEDNPEKVVLVDISLPRGIEQKLEYEGVFWKILNGDVTFTISCYIKNTQNEYWSLPIEVAWLLSEWEKVNH